MPSTMSPTRRPGRAQMKRKFVTPTTVQRVSAWVASSGIPNSHFKDDDTGDWGRELEQGGHSLALLYNYNGAVTELHTCACRGELLLPLVEAEFGPTVPAPEDE